MPDASMDQAKRVKSTMGDVVRGHGTLMGVGITKVGTSYAVKVNLSEPPAGSLPSTVDGVPVVYEVVGRIRAR